MRKVGCTPSSTCPAARSRAPRGPGAAGRGAPPREVTVDPEREALAAHREQPVLASLPECDDVRRVHPPVFQLPLAVPVAAERCPWAMTSFKDGLDRSKSASAPSPGTPTCAQRSASRPSAGAARCSSAVRPCQRAPARPQRTSRPAPSAPPWRLDRVLVDKLRGVQRHVLPRSPRAARARPDHQPSLRSVAAGVRRQGAGGRPHPPATHRRHALLPQRRALSSGHGRIVALVGQEGCSGTQNPPGVSPSPGRRAHPHQGPWFFSMVGMVRFA